MPSSVQPNVHTSLLPGGRLKHTSDKQSSFRGSLFFGSVVERLDDTKRLTVWDASATQITVNIGTGLLLLPNFMHSTGLVLGTVLLCLVGSMMAFTSFLLIKTMSWAEHYISKERADILRFEDIGEAAYGSWMYHVVKWVFHLKLECTYVVYIVILGDLLHGFYAFQGSEFYSKWCWKTVVAVIFIVVSMFEDLSFIAKLGNVGVFAAVSTTGSILVASILHIISNVRHDTHVELAIWPADIWAPIRSIAIYVFAFGGILVIPSLSEGLEDPGLKKAVCISNGVALLIYLAVSILAYFAYGSAVADNILDNIRDDFWWCGYIASGGSILNLLMTAPIYGNIITTWLETTFSISQKMRKPIRCLCVLVSYALACTKFSYFKPLVGLLPSVFSVVIVLVLPVLYFWALATKNEGSLKNAARIYTWRCVLDPLIITIAVVVAIVSVHGSIQDIIKIRANN